MKERLTRAAAAQGITRNALVVRSLERTLGIAHVDEELPAEAHIKPPCPHPKSAIRKLAYGTFCSECKTRLR